MKEIKELLLKRKREILQKLNYYEGRVKSKSKLVSESTKKAQDSDIFPYIFDRYTPKYEGLTLNMFSAILSWGGGFTDFLYIEDENPEVIWTIMEMDDAGEEADFVYYFPKHYCERFGSRNLVYRRYTGNQKEAMILDIFAGACLYWNGCTDTLYGQIIDPEKLLKLSPEKRFQWRETLKELSGHGFNKYFNENSNVSIMKTLDGYGIYKKEGDLIIMLTWLREDQLSQEQKNLAETLIEFVRP